MCNAVCTSSQAVSAVSQDTILTLFSRNPTAVVLRRLWQWWHRWHFSVSLSKMFRLKVFRVELNARLMSWSEACVVIEMHSSVFWVVTRRVVVLHWLFGTTYLSHVQDPWRWDRYVVPKRRYETTLRCARTQKTEDHILCQQFLRLAVFLSTHVITRTAGWTYQQRLHLCK
jgi:hypothetical protein